MTPAAAILQEVERAGLEVRVEAGGKLWVAPSEKLTPDLRERLRQHKTELLAFLRRGGLSHADQIDAFDNPAAFSELLGFPVHLASDLPAPPLLLVEGDHGQAYLDFNRRPPWIRRPEGAAPLFDPQEISRLVDNAEAGRLTPGGFAAFCQRKLQAPGWRLTRADSPVQSGDPSALWTVGLLLDAMGCQLRMVLIRSEADRLAVQGPYAGVRHGA